MWRVSHVLALKEHVNFTERRPQRIVTLPTLAHQVVDLPGTAGRLRQLDGGRRAREPTERHVVQPAILNHLLVVEPGERLHPSQTEHLPESHRERPDVALRRELTLNT